MGLRVSEVENKRWKLGKEKKVAVALAKLFSYGLDGRLIF